jgi:VWFA-related protein
MLRTIFTLALAASGLLAQAPTPGPVIRLDPVALDVSGQPVTDLTADDFKIVDQNRPQTIFTFHKPKNGLVVKLDMLEFSNRTSGATPHVTVIVLDLMNQNRPDGLDAWHALDKSLPQLESGDSVYFYVLNLEGELVPIHALGPKSADDATWPHEVVSVLDSAMKNALHGRPVHLGPEDQAKKTFHQLEVLATQMALFPGRRDIVWMTSGMQNAYNNKLPCNGDWVDCALYVPHLAVTLALANVAVNPLSNGRDVTTGVAPMMTMDTKSNPGKDQLSSVQDQQGTTASHGMAGAAGVDPALDLTQMARLTGGHAYFRQDIRAVLKQVITNAGASFDIAYAPPADNWDSKFHVIRVACSRPGVRLQLRERYYALADARPPGERMKAALMQAFQSPGDFTEIGVRTKLSLGAEDKTALHLETRLDPSDLVLQEQGGKYSGALYCLISDRGAAGPLGEPVVLDLRPELTAEQYKTALKEGLPFGQDHPISDAVRAVRVIVLDQNTNAVGSLTFPVK